MSVDTIRPGLVGARVPRLQDPRLLRGQGHYVDDIKLPGQVYAAVIRSDHAHGHIRGLDITAAAANPDVLDVITPNVVQATCRPIPCVWIKPGQRQVDYPVVPADKTRYAGEALGLVVARSRAAAADALGLIDIDIDPLPAVVDAHAAAADGAPLLNPGWGTNLAVESEFGDPAAVVEKAITQAPHVVSMRFRIPRQSGSPIEPRGLVARWDSGTQELTVWSSTQTPHHVRDHLAHVLKLGIDQVRVIAPDIGGGFGSKEHLYPDEVLVCLAATRLGLPVKWIETRHESFLATTHARDQFHDARLAFDEEGRFIALHSEILMDLGAHPSNVGSGPGHVASIMLQGPYRVNVAGTHLRCVVTNKTPVGALRGFGMQQATWVRERLVDEAARAIALDPAEIRRRNMIRRDELPYTTHFYQRYDSGDYVRAMEAILKELGANPAQPGDGRRRGLGLSSYVEFTGLGPSATQKIVGFHLSGYETAVVRVEPDGTATVSSGVTSIGQGIETTLAQLVGDRLGLPMDKIKVILGDSALAPYSGSGSIASRSMAVGGGATVVACDRLRRKILAIAAHKLEAAEGDLVLADGRVCVRGAPHRGVPIHEIASSAWLAWDLPDGVTPGLEEKEMYDPMDVSYSYATHGALVAVDPETGKIEVEKYAVAHDCGVVVNPMIVGGQIHGGVAQGLGAALLEEFVYDQSGQPQTATFLDYLLPSSAEVPAIVHEHIEIPSPFTPGGMKGMGEGGAIAPPAAIGNALCNALPEIAHLVTDLPMTPARVWSWVHDAGVRGG